VSVRHLPAADAATLFGGFGLTTPAAAPAVAQSAAVDAYALTTARVVGSVAALVALAGVVVGGLALARLFVASATAGEGAIVALVAGPTGYGHRQTVVAAAEDGPGTGYGIVGGFAGLTRDLIAAKRGAACRAWRAVRACPACR
jgi:Family of unknown function (DUF6223)